MNKIRRSIIAATEITKDTTRRINSETTSVHTPHSIQKTHRLARLLRKSIMQNSVAMRFEILCRATAAKHTLYHRFYYSYQLPKLQTRMFRFIILENAKRVQASNANVFSVLAIHIYTNSQKSSKSIQIVFYAIYIR